MNKHYICAVDADIIAYRIAAACEESSQETMEDTIRGFIYEMWRETQASYYLFTLTGSYNYRTDVATIKPYKGNRTNTQRPKWLPLARQYILDEYKGLIVEGFEGDDVCVSIAHRYRDCNPIIASVDKDLLQYPAFHYNLVKREMQEISQTKGDALLWKQVLTGDATDNIGGLPGIGPKKAEVWLQNKLLEGISLPHAAWLMYDAMGYDYAYFQENLDLIRMRTDVYAPYEEHFVVLDYKGTEEEEFSLGNQIKDLSKDSYAKFDNIITPFGKLRDETIYSFPIAELDIVDKDGNKQIELLNLKFEPGEHIEEVRRGMNQWASINFPDMTPDALWLHMGFYELMSDGMFRKVVETKQSMRQ